MIMNPDPGSSMASYSFLPLNGISILRRGIVMHPSVHLHFPSISAVNVIIDPSLGIVTLYQLAVKSSDWGFIGSSRTVIPITAVLGEAGRVGLVSIFEGRTSLMAEYSQHYDGVPIYLQK